MPSDPRVPLPQEEAPRCNQGPKGCPSYQLRGACLHQPSAPSPSGAGAPPATSTLDVPMEWHDAPTLGVSDSVRVGIEQACRDEGTFLTDADLGGTSSGGAPAGDPTPDDATCRCGHAGERHRYDPEADDVECSGGECRCRGFVPTWRCPKCGQLYEHAGPVDPCPRCFPVPLSEVRGILKGFTRICSHGSPVDDHPLPSVSPPPSGEERPALTREGFRPATMEPFYVGDAETVRAAIWVLRNQRAAGRIEFDDRGHLDRIADAIEAASSSSVPSATGETARLRAALTPDALNGLARRFFGHHRDCRCAKCAPAHALLDAFGAALSPTGQETR
jgi:hypothetical protein